MSDSSDDDDDEDAVAAAAVMDRMAAQPEEDRAIAPPAMAPPPPPLKVKPAPLRPGEAFTMPADHAIILAVTKANGAAQEARDALVADGSLDAGFTAEMVLERFTRLCEEAAMEESGAL